MTRLAPTRINGRYELHRRLGRGGMAEVYLARDQMLDRAVAVKVLFPALATDPGFVERFRREAQSAAGLNHPNIVSVYDWGEANGTYFIVMEYVEGESLAELIAHEGRLHADRAAEIAADIASALGFAHRTGGVIHRDVKPGNVLITREGEVKVADFGITAALDPAASRTGGAAAGIRRDVDGLAYVLYEMITGRPPSTDGNLVAPRSLDPAIPSTVEAIALKALATNPANRYPSARDMRSDLRRYLDGARIGTRPVQVPKPAPAPAVDPDATAVMTTIDDTVVTPRPAGSDAGYHGADRAGGDHGDDRYDEDEDGDAGPVRPYAFIAVLVVVVLVLVGLLFVVNSARSSGGDEAGGSAGDVAVPRVLGLPQADAEAALAQVDLVATVEAVADDAAAGTVVDQEPAANESLAPGSNVTLTVSSGPAAVAVPDLGGMTRDDALRAITDLGLVPSPTQVVNDTVPEGHVIGTDPPAGSQTTPGATIVIQVSARPTTTVVPDVTGQPEAQARATLEAAGFTVTTADEPTRRRRRDGLVLRQTPEGNTPVPGGTAVEIVIGRSGDFDWDFDND